MLKYLKKIINYLFKQEPPTTLDDHIESNKRAAIKHDYKTDQLFPMEYGWCCPGCAYGRDYTEWCNKQDRRLFWLAQLLKKRNTPEDIKLAKLIDTGFWP